MTSDRSLETTDRAALIARALEARKKTVAAREEELAADEALRAFDMKAAGLAVGDVVEKNGHRYQVTEVAIWQFYDEKPKFALHGAPQLKDGSFGKQRRWIGMDWKHVGAMS